jgi:hypothetical protein
MIPDEALNHLHDFIVQAKKATYVGDGEETTSSRVGSHDLEFTQGAFRYLDSYFGGQDFIGQEVVYYEDKPVWAMNYYGKILMPKQITPAQTGAIIKESLSKLYQQGRFLGSFEHQVENYNYYDTSIGGVSAFSGREWITLNKEVVYELLYHGGLIK